MPFDIGSLIVTIKADLAQFGAAMGKADQQVREFASNTEDLTFNMRRMGLIMTAFGGGVLLFMTKMAQKAADAMGDPTFTDAMNEMQDDIEGLQIAIGERATPAITALVKKLGDFARGLEDVKIKEWNTDLLSIVVNALIVGAGLAVLAGIIFTAGWAFGILSVAAKAAGGALAGLYAGPISALLDLGAVLIPVLMSFLPILALFALAWIFNWGNIRQHVDKIVEGLKIMISGLFDIIGGIGTMIIGILTLDTGKIWAGFTQLVTGVAKILFGAFKIIFEGVVGFFFDLFVGVMKFTFDLLAGIDKAWATIVATVKTWVIGLVGSVVGFFVDMANKIIDVLNGFISAYNAVASKTGGLLSQAQMFGRVSGAGIWDTAGMQAAVQSELAASIAGTEAKRLAYQQTVNFQFSDFAVVGNFDDFARRISEIIAQSLREQNQYGGGA